MFKNNEYKNINIYYSEIRCSGFSCDPSYSNITLIY